MTSVLNSIDSASFIGTPNPLIIIVVLRYCFGIWPNGAFGLFEFPICVRTYLDSIINPYELSYFSAIIGLAIPWSSFPTPFPGPCHPICSIIIWALDFLGSFPDLLSLAAIASSSDWFAIYRLDSLALWSSSAYSFLILIYNSLYFLFFNFRNYSKSFA